MNPLKEYQISFTGLAEGIHSFEFVADGMFFGAFECSEILDSDVKINVLLEKKIDMLILEFQISGKVSCVCDRCSENYWQDIAGKEQLIIKFGEDIEESTDEIRVVSSKEHMIDISQDVYEFINLLLPQRRVHPDDSNGNTMCNKETLAFLNKLSQQNIQDPRWDELKKISFNN